MIFPMLSSRLMLFSDYVRPAITAQCVRFKHAVLDPTFLAQRLNIPAKPTKPLTVFFRYQKDQLQSVKAKHPELTVPERAKILGKMWNALDAANKEKYFKSFANDNNVYRQQLAEYYQKITEGDMQRLHAKRMELKEEIAKRKRSSLQRRKLASLNRPMKPTSGFMKFLTTSKDRKPNEKSRDFVQRKAGEWHKLSDKQQAAYKVSEKDMNKYKKDYALWRDKMIFSGKHHLIAPIKKNTKYRDILNSK